MLVGKSIKLPNIQFLYFFNYEIIVYFVIIFVIILK
jgi:hypothetical protein